MVNFDINDIINNANKVAAVHSHRSSGEACPPVGGWNNWNRLSTKFTWIEQQMAYPYGMQFRCGRFGSGATAYARCW